MFTRTVRLAWAVVDKDVSVVVTGEHTACIAIAISNTCSVRFITGSNTLGRKVMPNRIGMESMKLTCCAFSLCSGSTQAVPQLQHWSHPVQGHPSKIQTF